MKPKHLLSQLAELEETLNNFSFEELTAADAARLKSSFDAFKIHLEQKIWGGPETEIQTEQDNSMTGEKAPSELNREERLIATVSHEIRTPLNGIIGFTDLLKESKLSAEQENQVNAIQSASHNLLDIINELLEYSKLTAGLEHFEQLEFNFESIIQDVVYLCDTLMLGKDVTLKVEIDKNLPAILVGDPSKLSQVLLNLLGNSIKFVERGTIVLKARLKKEAEEKVWIEFVISDTGIGISEHELKHIFDSFKQANQHTFSKYGGTGLGLNIVKQIVERLNGNLQVNSRLGVGTTFRFTLAYGRGTTQEAAPPEPTANAEAAVNGMRILVFEDNLMNQRLIEQRLKSWGCKTYITENANYGLNLLENTDVDLILMDLRMPVMNGFEATRRIRAHRDARIRQLPIVALTADFTIEDKLECEARGINDFILKPFSPEELLDKIIRNKGNNGTFPAEIEALGQPEPTTDLDLTQALEDCMDDVDVLEELVQLFKQNALEFIGHMKIHLANNNFEEIRNAAHKLKCGLAMMQTHSLHFIVEKIHNNARTIKDIKHLERLYDSFVTQYPTVAEAIDQEVDRIKNNRNRGDD